MLCTPPSCSRQKRIGTHDGTFHCDEALACFLLKRTKEFSGASITRTRDPAVLDTVRISRSALSSPTPHSTSLFQPPSVAKSGYLADYECGALFAAYDGGGSGLTVEGREGRRVADD